VEIYLTEPVGPFARVLGASFSNFTTRQDVTFTAGAFSLPTIPAGKLTPGRQLEIDANGEFSTTGTPTLALGFYIGTQAAAITTVLAESGAITTGSAAASWPWLLHWEGVVTQDGPTGSVTGHGTLQLGTSLTALAVSAIPTTLAARTVAIDTTIARAIGVCATWGTASASNAVKVYKHRVTINN